MSKMEKKLLLEIIEALEKGSHNAMLVGKVSPSAKEDEVFIDKVILKVKEYEKSRRIYF